MIPGMDIQGREEIYSFIEENKIDGVVFLSADRHRSYAWKIFRPDWYNFYNLSSAKLTKSQPHDVLEESLFGYNQKPSFGVLEFDTKADDPELTYKIYNIDNKLIHQITLFQSQFTYN